MFNFYDPLTSRTLKYNENHDDRGRFAPTSDVGALGNQTDDVKAHNSAVLDKARTEATTMGPDKVGSTVKAVLSRGYKEVTKPGVGTGMRSFAKDVSTDDHNVVHNFIGVMPDGTWQHTAEGIHDGQGPHDLGRITGDSHLASSEAPPAPKAPAPYDAFLPGDVAPTHQGGGGGRSGGQSFEAFLPGDNTPTHQNVSSGVQIPYAPPDAKPWMATPHNFRVDDVAMPEAPHREGNTPRPAATETPASFKAPARQSLFTSPAGGYKPSIYAKVTGTAFTAERKAHPLYKD